MNMLRLVALIVIALARAETGVADPSMEAGSDYYRVVINGAEMPLYQGNPAVIAGPLHPASVVLGRLAEMSGIRRTCPSCTGHDEVSFATVRSYSASRDIRLGGTRDALLEASPGFTCVVASELHEPSIDPIVVDAEERGVMASWHVGFVDEVLDIAERMVVHGTDHVDSSVELTINVVNVGTSPVAIGVRLPLYLRMTPDDPVGNSAHEWHVAVRRDGQPAGTLTHEFEQPGAAFDAWQLNPRRFTYPNPWYPYHVGGRSQPSPSLDPPPVVPDIIQAAGGNLTGERGSGLEGVLDACFAWSIPHPPRDLVFGLDLGMFVSYWGATPETAIILAPGEEFSATQYLVAYQEYPIQVTIDTPAETPCEGATTRVPVRAEDLPIVPTAGAFHHRWRSDDPRVTFVDATAAETEAIVEGAGEFEVAVSSFIGAYEASATATLNVVDSSAPRFIELRASPDVLWPPNHRHVPITVFATIEDDCDPVPRLRLVSVTSNEPDDARGDGRTVGDISGVTLGTDDRHLLLRAERDGRGSGRRYDLTYEAEDASGNIATEVVSVVVPHDARRAR